MKTETKKDILKVVAFCQVRGLSIYGKRYVGFDQGKNNLKDYFCTKQKWSVNKLTNIVRMLKIEGVLTREKSDADTQLLSLSTLRKLSLKFVDYEAFAELKS